MEVQEWIEELVKACKSGEVLRAFGSDVWSRDLVREEEEILVAAANGEKIELYLSPGVDFPSIYISGSPVFRKSDPYSQSEQWYAMMTLATRGVLAYSGDGVFTLDETARLRGARLRMLRLLHAGEQENGHSPIYS